MGRAPMSLKSDIVIYDFRAYIDVPVEGFDRLPDKFVASELHGVRCLVVDALPQLLELVLGKVLVRRKRLGAVWLDELLCGQFFGYLLPCTANPLLCNFTQHVCPAM